MKICARCNEQRPDARFRHNRATCIDCQNSDDRRRRAERSGKAPDDGGPSADQLQQASRIASDFAQLKPEDFDVTIGNDGRIDPGASKEKRQEYSKRMGEALAEAAAGEEPSDTTIRYLAGLAEQERRFGNRRLARSFSISQAHEMLGIALFKTAAEKYLTGRIEARGWAQAKRAPTTQRSVCLLLSDLHLGANLSPLDEPVPFGANEEARRLEYIIRQAADYKSQYRDHTELVLLINGDVIEGLLGHDLRDGAPLAEQKTIFWRLMADAIGYLASAFPKIRVVCQPGNHGRDKVRHPGRATSRKWDGHEWEMYFALSVMARDLKNVSWEIPLRAVSIVDLYGKKLLVSHGDTEIHLGDPDTKSKENAAILDRISSMQIYGCHIDAAAFGHFHKGRYQPRNPRVLWNGALIPPNGYARTAGYIGEPCGQWLWEAVPGYPVGDVRFVEVGAAQDRDTSLGQIVRPFRLEAP